MGNGDRTSVGSGFQHFINLNNPCSKVTLSWFGHSVLCRLTTLVCDVGSDLQISESVSQGGALLFGVDTNHWKLLLSLDPPTC